MSDSLNCFLDTVFLQIRRMELEARSSQGTTKATLMAKLREYKTDVSNIKREMKRVSSDSADERDQLLELGMTPQSPVSFYCFYFF